MLRVAPSARYSTRSPTTEGPVEDGGVGGAYSRIFVRVLPVYVGM